MSALSIGREYPVWKWLGSFGLYVTASLGFMFGAIAYFKINEAFLPQQLLGVQVLECAAALLAAAVGATGRTARYYRGRYHQYRDAAAIKDVYHDRTWLQAHYGDFLAPSKQLIACGISLHTLTTETFFEGWISEALANNRGLDIRLVYLKAYCREAAQREKEENRPYGRVSLDCRMNVNIALRIKAALGQLGDRLHVHVVEGYAPVAFVLISDDDMFFEPYLHASIGRTCPVFRLQRNRLNERVWDKLAGHVRALIGASEEKAAQDEIAPVITHFGATDSRTRLRKAVFLDRDGVLMEDKHYLADASQVVILEGVYEALRSLVQHYRLIVVTNQSGIARGILTERDLDAIHQRMLTMLNDNGVEIDGIYYCPHYPDGAVDLYSKDCECRKPKPGLLKDAMGRFEIVPGESFMVGDKIIDIEAGKNAGTKTILIGGSRDEAIVPDYRVSSLAEAVQIILS